MRDNTNTAFRRKNSSRLRHISGHCRSALTAWMRIPLKRSGIHLVTLALGLLTISLLINFVNQVIQSANLEDKRTQLEAEVAQLEGETARLSAAVEYAESDVHVERIAREQLGYAREGDIVVLPRYLAPTPTPEPAADAPAVAPEVQPAEPNWQRWWHVFVPDEEHPALDDQ
jgi:cell division protein FtsB